MAPLLIIRADADVATGSGHVMRCLALAKEWQEHGGEAIFWGRINAGPLRERIAAEGCRLRLLPALHPDPADLAAVVAWLREEHGQPGWVVLDGYHFDAGYHDAIRALGWSLLVVDDYAHLPEYHADILLNPNAHAEELSYNTDAETLRLLGTRFAPLRREFYLARQQERIVADRGCRILVTMGGADQDNVCGRVVDALLAMGRNDLEVKIVSGSLNPHRQDLAKRLEKALFEAELLVAVAEMAPLMQWADLAISAAGSTCWELATLGVPMLVTVLAENQERVAASLEAHGTAINLGWFHAWQPGQVAGVIEGLLADQEQRRRMGENGRWLVDGRGSERLVHAMHAVHFSLRLATVEDCALVYQWANDPQARAASFRPAFISREEHCRWFAERLADPAHVFFLAITADDRPLGQIRFAVDRDEAMISISLAKDFRGAGLGPRLIRHACRLVMDAKSLRKIRALIKEENSSSIQAFSRAGFRRTGTAKHFDRPAVAMEYTRENATT